MDLQPLLHNLGVEEGRKGSAYDDATGAYVRAGTRVEGNVTVGVGINLAYPNGLTDQEIDYLLNNRVQIALYEVENLGWPLDDVRKLAVTDMMFNLGAVKFATFDTFAALMKAGNYQAAADDLETTAWYNEVGERGQRLAGIIRTGTWQSA